MERFRQKKSKIWSLTDPSSRKLTSPGAASRQGNTQNQRPRNLPKFASDTSSCSSDVTEDDQYTFELGRNSAQRVIGAPIRMLLAEEMLKDTESKRRSPSVIARLMGLDGLPPQPPTHKQPKRLSESYHQRTASIESQRNSSSYEDRHSRRSSREQQEFKDVFEVIETPKVEGFSVPLQKNDSSKLTEARMEFIWQKFLDAKCLSTNENLQDSKEFHNALEVLDSNKDLFLKFLQEPDSLFTKHLRDLQGAPPQSHCSHIAAVRSSSAHNYEKSVIGCKSGRETSRRSDNNSFSWKHDGLSSHAHGECAHGERGLHGSVKSNAWLERKDEPRILPTRIVVLKPNLVKAQNATKSVSPAHSSLAFHSDCRMNRESPIMRNRGAKLLEKEKFNDMGPPSYRPRESREVAKEITKRMKNNLSDRSMKLSSRIGGYAGDESSCNMSGNDSANESEATTLTSQNFFEYNNWYGPSSSHPAESSVNKEAKKRLSERWNMTRRFQELGVVSRGSTLGEMLAIPDRELLSEKNLDVMIGQERSHGSDKTLGYVRPLGISSRDGWKDVSICKLTRSRSLPALPVTFGSPKASMRHEDLGDDRYLILKEATNLGRNKAVRRNFNQKEGLSSRRSSYRRSRSPRCTSSVTNDAFSQNSEKSHYADKPAKKSMEPKISTGYTDTASVLDPLVDEELENVNKSSEFSDLLVQEASGCMLVKADSSTDQNHSVQQDLSIGPSEGTSVPLSCPVPEPESPASSKEADQPSPVSVMEAPFTEDLSSGSECFERVSADLHGLRMQLQLLKLESEAYAEGPMLISSDEDVEEESVGVSKKKEGADESWESSYIVDVLALSGFNDTDPNMSTATWYSPECPIGPLVFEKLEKKHSDQTISRSSERRLLFNRINSALVEIFQRFNPQLWPKQGVVTIGRKWHEHGVEGELCQLLASQEREANADIAELVLGKDSQWLNLGDYVDVICREVGILLLDDLVTEVVTM